MKLLLREKAIQLRMAGFSYREIMEQVPVAKSTISLWLRAVGLSKQQKQRLTEKKLAAIQKGATAKRAARIARTQRVIDQAAREIRTISQRELWLMGTMLYWAEGAKEKACHPGSGVKFSNTDPEMINIFLCWLKRNCGKGPRDIAVELYIHELHKERLKEILNFWEKKLNFPQNYIQRIYYKKGNPQTLRKNIGESYHGTLVVKVKASSVLNRQIAGWIKGVVNCLR